MEEKLITMYPGTDYAHYTENFETFADLKTAVEDCPEDLNQIISWAFYEPDGFDEIEETEFEITIFLPRKTRVTQFKLNTEPTDEIKLWIEHYLRKRAVGYFNVSWKGGGE
jgi:hypothetical protein